MFVECLNETRVQHNGREYLFEEVLKFGYLYEVDKDLGEKAVKTGNLREVPVDPDSGKLDKFYDKVIPEIPSSRPIGQ